MATEQATTNTPTQLEQVAHRQSEELSNVRALLVGVEQMLELLPDDATPETIRRLVQMADQKLEAVQNAFDPYI